MILQIKNLFKKPKDVTVHKTGKVIEWAFKCNGKHYYKLINDYDMFQERASFLMTYANEMDMKLTKETLGQFMEALMNHINDGKLGDAANLVKEIEYRMKWLFEPETLYRLASVVYFDLKENIKDYDVQYNKKKIASFKKKDLMSYFLEQLTNGQNPFSNLSEEDSQRYLQKLSELIKKQSLLLSNTKDTNNNYQKEKQTTV